MDNLAKLLKYNGILEEKKPDISGNVEKIAADIDYLAMMMDVEMEDDDDE